MSDDVVDQVIALTPAEPVIEEKVEEQVSGETEAAQEEPKTDPALEKKFENMKSRLKNENRFLKKQAEAERAELLKRIELLEKQNAPKSDEPQEESFDNYGEYLKAVAKHEARKEFLETQKSQQETQKLSQDETNHQAWVEERATAADVKISELSATLPDFKSLEVEMSEAVSSFPPEIALALLQAENAPLAVYALAKEGKLYDLADMPYPQAVREIARAEMRGEAFLKKPTSSAPSPLQSNRGTSPVGTKAENMSPDELLKMIRG